MKKTLLTLIAALFFIPFTAGAVPCAPNQGCTGTSTPPTYGQLLVGNSSGTYTLTATSSLGISGSFFAPGILGSVPFNDGSGNLTASGQLNYFPGPLDRLTVGASSTPYYKLTVQGMGTPLEPDNNLFAVASSTGTVILGVYGNGSVKVTGTETVSGALTPGQIIDSVSSNGSSGQVLTANGTGGFTWSPASGGTGGVGTFSTTTPFGTTQLQYPTFSPTVTSLDTNSTSTSKYWFNPAASTAYLAGNVGIGTTSPYAMLSVAGLGVFRNIFSTSTTATSTFNGPVGFGTSTVYTNSGIVQQTLIDICGNLIMNQTNIAGTGDCQVDPLHPSTPPSLGNIYIGDNHYLYFMGALGFQGGSIFYNFFHDANQGELQLNSSNSFSLNAGMNGLHSGTIQIGGSGSYFETANLQYNGNATSSILNYAINSGGTGYIAGDVLTIPGCSGCVSPTTLTLTSGNLSGGVITSLPYTQNQLINGIGEGYSLGSVALTGGTGSGANINITQVTSSRTAKKLTFTSQYYNKNAHNSNITVMSIVTDPNDGCAVLCTGLDTMSIYDNDPSFGNPSANTGVGRLVASLNINRFGASSFTASSTTATSTLNIASTTKLYDAELATAAGTFVAVDPTGHFIATTTSSSGITALTGDVTASGLGSVPATLATVNSNVGSFTNASITVNGKGLVTAASNGTAPVTNVTGSGNIASSGGTTPNITLTGTVPIANGGTNSSTIGASSTVAISNGTSITYMATSSLGLGGTGSGTVNSGTTGQVPYYAANGTAVTATSSIFVAPTGFIGIGTTNPSEQLTVSNNGFTQLRLISTDNTKYAQFVYQGTGRTYSTGVGSVSESAVGVANKYFVYDTTAGAARLVIDSNGNTGIGTTSPWRTLSVNGNSDLGQNALAGYFTATTSTPSSFNGGLTAYASSTIGNGTQTGGLTINGGATTTGSSFVSGSERVGTTDSSYQLGVKNTLGIVADSATDPQLFLDGTTAGGHKWDIFAYSIAAHAPNRTGLGFYDATANVTPFFFTTSNWNFVSGYNLDWTDNASFPESGTVDVGLKRNAAGILEIDNGVAGTYRDLLLRNLTASGKGAFGTTSPVAQLAASSTATGIPALMTNGSVYAYSLSSGSGTAACISSSSQLVTCSGGTATSTASFRNQTATISSVNTYTPTASSTYEVSVDASIKTISAGTLTITCTYTNTDGTATTATFFPMGLTTAGLSNTGSPALSPLIITPMKNNPVTVVATFTGVSVTYDIDASIIPVGTSVN